MLGDSIGNPRPLRPQSALCIRAPTTGIQTVTLASSIEAATPANLLSRKQGLIERLHEDPGPHERNEIERLLADIDQALDVFDQCGPGQKRTLSGRNA
jgi:hypothetical protein